MSLISKIKNSFATIFDTENSEKKLSVNFLVKNSANTNYYAKEYESIKKKMTLTNINMGNIGYLTLDFSSKTESRGYSVYSHYITQKNLFDIEVEYTPFITLIEDNPLDFLNNISKKYKKKVLFIQGNLDKSLFFVPCEIEEPEEDSGCGKKKKNMKSESSDVDTQTINLTQGDNLDEIIQEAALSVEQLSVDPAIAEQLAELARLKEKEAQMNQILQDQPFLVL
jgi:hypothetical protein